MTDEEDLKEAKARQELRDAANRLRALKGEAPEPRVEIEPPFCSFCGKGKNEYRQIVQGPSVYICDECVLKCQEIIAGRESNDPIPT